MSNIHDYHSALPLEDYNRLEAAAATQEEQILRMLCARPDHHFAYFEIKEQTGYNKDSAKRSLSNLSGSGSPAYKDAYGNWPVVYNKDYRKKNIITATTCGTYQMNPIYGIRPAHPEDTPDRQTEIFGAPATKHPNGIFL